MKKTVGLRTCRVCRVKREKKELLRLVLLNTKPSCHASDVTTGNMKTGSEDSNAYFRTKTLELDSRQILPGRGWYLCRAEICRNALKSPKGLQKAFGRGIERGPVLNQYIMIPPSGRAYGQN